MNIKDHKLENITYTPSPNKGGVINPSVIVMHYTAGWTASSAISWLCDPSAKVSAHLVIDWDGTITQLVPFNIAAWHAGPSSHKGLTGLNNYSIGIEFVNPGYLRKTESGTFLDSNGKIVKNDYGHPHNLIEAAHPRVGSGNFYWPVYPEKQLQAGLEVTKHLLNKYGINDIVSHEEIDTRKWKTDPGPAFPMTKFRALIGNQEDYSVFKVTATTLNVRSGPGTSFGIIDKLFKGNIVVIESEHGDWSKLAGSDGFVHSSYLSVV